MGTFWAWLVDGALQREPSLAQVCPAEIAYPKAWSPGTDGTVRAEAVFLDVKSVADLEKYRGKLKGKIVLFSEERHVNPLFEPASSSAD